MVKSKKREREKFPSNIAAIGASDGNVKVWSVASGQCIRRFDHAHAQGITAISFMRDASKIVTCSFDETVRYIIYSINCCLFINTKI